MDCESEKITQGLRFWADIKLNVCALANFENQFLELSLFNVLLISFFDSYCRQR